ncbi:MAG: hypothetical protein OXF48_04265, partial [Bacteroidetes bacterium]|nr:hypothetical protein [Bacteroidota bacterium]
MFIAFFASNVHSQSILFQSDGGELSVNGNVIALDALPKDLEFGEIDFSLQAISTFPMRVEINGKSYEIWEDRIIAASEAGNVHYRLSIGADGSFVSVESTGVLDFYGIENILSRQNGAVISPGMQIWDSLEYVANLLAPSPPPPPPPPQPPPPPPPPP